MARQLYRYLENIRDHPRACKNSRRKLPEHILIAEKALGKYLPLKAVVHHVDSNGCNNASDNLVICEDTAYHALLHVRTRAFYACGNANWRKCGRCKQYSPIEFLRKKREGDYYHRFCTRDRINTILLKFKEGRVSSEEVIATINKLVKI